jgi:hypothetical protein
MKLTVLIVCMDGRRDVKADASPFPFADYSLSVKALLMRGTAAIPTSRPRSQAQDGQNLKPHRIGAKR